MAGFADNNSAKIETANKIIPKGTFINATRLGFVMSYKGKVYHSRLIEEWPYNSVGCV